MVSSIKYACARKRPTGRTNKRSARICSLVCKWHESYFGFSAPRCWWWWLRARAGNGQTDRHHHATDFYATPKSNPLSSTSLYFSSFYGSSDGCAYESVVSFQHFHKFILSLFSYSFVLSMIFFLRVCALRPFSFHFHSHFVSLGLDFVSSPHYIYRISVAARPSTRRVCIEVSARGGSWCHNFVFGVETKKESEKKTKPKIEMYTVSSRKKSILYFYDRIRKAVNLQRQFPL